MRSPRPWRPARESPIKRTILVLVGLAVSGLGLYLAFRDVDVLLVLKGMWRAKLFFVILSAGFYGIAFIFRSIRWRFLLKPLGTISLTRLFFALMFGFFINEILPLRIGEVARAMLVANWMKIPVAATLG